MSDDLRTLAQAVVDAVDAFHAAREPWHAPGDECLRAAANAASDQLGRALCLPSATQYTARAILAHHLAHRPRAALDAADAAPEAP